MFSVPLPFTAVIEIQSDHPHQLSVIQDQPVRVLDSQRGDWWLVSTIPDSEELEGGAGEEPKEGWVRAELLQADEGVCALMRGCWCVEGVALGGGVS